MKINFTEYFRLKDEQESFESIHEVVEKGISFKGTNLWILVFAIFIASVGLNVNSTAVIIGAMLVSPLMGPIIGVGYSLATYDFKLLKKAFINLAFSTFVSLLTSTFYFLLSPINDAHSELLARTSPTIYDVLIAFFGGLAGIVAMASKNKGNVLPGVAIATALMPPLCTTGYGLATMQWKFFLGAFYLFTINTVFIGIATLVMVRFLKFPVYDQIDEKRKKNADKWVSIITLLTLVPSIYLGYVLIQQDRFQRKAEEFIKYDSFIEGDYLLNSEVEARSKRITLIYGGKPIADEEKQQLQKALEKYQIPEAKLEIRQGFSMDEVSKQLSKNEQMQIEISKVRAEATLYQKQLDSLKNRKLIARELYQEAKIIFPEITSCATSEQLFFADSAQYQQRNFLVLIQTKNRAQTQANLPKIKAWFATRLKEPDLKVMLSNP
jgi:uncharacterized hydrophobic protein (TIGR00271 family)